MNDSENDGATREEPGASEGIGAGGEFSEAGFRKMAEENKRLEKRARESEENLEALMHATSQVVWRVDENGLDFGNGDFWSDLTGQGPDEMQGDGWLEVVHPADRESVRLAWGQAMETKSRYRAEYRVLDRQGNYQYLDVSGVPLLNLDGSFRLWIGTMTNVSDRVRSDQALRSSEASLRMLIESATEFAILTTSEDGTINTWSEGAERIFGYAEEEVLGSSFDILFLPEDRAAGVPKGELRTALEKGYSPDERWPLRKDGTVFFASGAASPIRGSDPVEFVKIARDLTDRKRMEEALMDADRRKTEFLATLSHELRNPLAPIRSGLDLLKRAGYDRRLITRTLKVIERQSDQIVHLLEDLLDVSRITQGKINLKIERVDLCALATHVLTNTDALMRERGHRLTVEVPETGILIDADPIRIEQVMVNLLNNAAKYTAPGGQICFSVIAENESAVVSVVDHGIGISPDKLEDVFEMFNQAETPLEESHSGLGVGLSVVKGLVELHGGTVAAFSEGRGKGSEFVVRLPLVGTVDPVAESDDPVSPGDEGPPAAAGGKRVLVVDDNRDAVAMLQILLTMEGHDVRVAFDGEAAVEVAREFCPDICLCDLGLPKIDGFEVARRLRVQAPGTLLISVSGWGQDADRLRSQEAGFAHHLVKPVRIDDIMAFFG